MKSRIFIAVLVALVVTVLGVRYFWPAGPVPEGTPTPAPTGPGWVNLLDADHVSGWKNITDDRDIFEIKDGTLHIFGHSIYPLRYVGYTSKRFGDFDLHIEFKLEGGSNSGVFLRVQPNDPVYRGFEVQVLDDYGEAPNKNGSGAIYDVVTPMFNMARPAGDWNSYDISVHGRKVSVTMNGWLIIQTDFSKMTKPLGKFKVAYADVPLDGLLTLQDHGGEVWYRNIYIKPAPQDKSEK